MGNKKNRDIVFALTLTALAFAASANPIVFLHGWNSAGDLWDNIRALAVKPVAEGGMGIVADDMIALSYYAASGDYGLGCSVYTPIQEVATNAARVIKAFQEKKGVPVDVVCHSMGGLVFRSMVADGLIDTTTVRRYITLGTPHYGQNADMSYQAQQMYYGSDFLWKLGAAWHFENRGWPNDRTLCIAGITDNKITALKPSGSYWDGLVHAWSASLGSGVPVRYAYRSHSSANDWQGANAYGLCVVPDGTKDAVFCMIREFFGSGTVPESLTPMYGGAQDRPKASTETSYGTFESWAAEEQGLWALFVQFVDSNNNPYHYSTYGYLNDFLVDGKAPSSLSILYGSSWGPISKADTYSYTLGAAEIFGNIPTNGIFGIRMLRPDANGKPDKSSSSSLFYLADLAAKGVEPAPGSCRFVRLGGSDASAEVQTAVATVAGRTVTIPIDWLVEQGLLDAGSVNDAAARDAALSNIRANGYTGAGCYYFDVDPDDAEDRSWIDATGFAFANGIATVSYDRDEAEVEKEYVHLQYAATLPGRFEDMDDSKVTHEDTSLSVAADPNAKSGFYRPFVR